MTQGDPDIKKYCELMEEIKLRINVVEFFISGKGHALYEPPTLESTTLQLRKILELIAFGSLVANRDAYSEVYAKVSKSWNAGDLLRELEEINPDFYPVPVIQVSSKPPGLFMEHRKREPVDYLTKNDFREVYGRCGVMAHAANPYGKGIDYGYFKRQLPVWRKQIVNLLNGHEIHLLNDPGMYTIHMSVHGYDRVHWYKFEPSTEPKS
ncbi:MAG TPA: hypothetical protein VN948_15400 [Terriglobales bacterium]|nr:hypothetical protein [Terriglobales bacterium]